MRAVRKAKDLLLLLVIVIGFMIVLAYYSVVFLLGYAIEAIKDRLFR